MQKTKHCVYGNMIEHKMKEAIRSKGAEELHVYLHSSIFKN